MFNNTLSRLNTDGACWEVITLALEFFSLPLFTSLHFFFLSSLKLNTFFFSNNNDFLSHPTPDVYFRDLGICSAYPDYAYSTVQYKGINTSNDKLKKALFALRPLLPSFYGVDLCLEFCTSSLTFLYRIFCNMQIMASVNP